MRRFRFAGGDGEPISTDVEFTMKRVTRDPLVSRDVDAHRHREPINHPPILAARPELKLMVETGAGS